VATTESREYCDVVMKGGITSGVVYPLAINELRGKYLFKNIGGNSAGSLPRNCIACRWRRCGSRNCEQPFGFCAGFDPAAKIGPPFTNWLHGKVQAASGKAIDSPLTFGDL